MKPLKLITFLAFTALSANLSAQTAITRIFTNYHGFWTSNTTNVSSVLPDSSHLLLAFTYNGTTFSTGIANNLLIDSSVVFAPTTFNSFVLSNSSIVPGTGTVIGVGNLFGGGSGNISPIPVTNNLSQYLSDGLNGLNLGTAIFNVPTSKMNFDVTGMNIGAVGDGSPDIVVTQVGQPPAANSLDTFRFENSVGITVGNPVAVSLSGISVVSNGDWKFYDPGTTPTYNSGLQGSRPLRLVAFDLADFGLTSANIGSVTRFVHKLSGNSDQAFVAYNTSSFTAGTGVILPITLKDFTAIKSGKAASISWSVTEAKSFSHFELERSCGDDKHFVNICRINYNGNGDASSYSYVDEVPQNGLNYYRLKMVDQDGRSSFSIIRLLDFGPKNKAVVYPNPSNKTFYLQLPEDLQSIKIYNSVGELINVQISGTGKYRSIDGRLLPAGAYYIYILASNETQILQVIRN